MKKQIENATTIKSPFRRKKERPFKYLAKLGTSNDFIPNQRKLLFHNQVTFFWSILSA